MDKILSVIIPTYNMEKYLHKCLNSLLVSDKSLFDQLEVLVINDGSKDSSSEIAHEYQNQYSSVFRVIDKENGNYGSCINRGLLEATGKYVKVLDADDSFSVDAFEIYLSELQHTDADLVLSDLVMVDEYDKITWQSSYKDGPEYMPVRLKFDFCSYINRPDVDYYGMMHGFAYRREILIENGYVQIEGRPYTDQQWVFEPIRYVKTAYYVDVNLYNYLVGREGQTVSSVNMVKSVDNLIFMVEKLFSLYEAGLSEYKKYYLRQVRVQLEFLYKKGIIEDAYPIDKLVKLDKEIQHIPDINSLLNSFRYYKVPYVIEWRRHTYLRTAYMVYCIKWLKVLLGKPV